MIERYGQLSTLIIILISASALSILATTAYAQEQKFTASLSGSQEVPPNTSTAKGSAWFMHVGNTISYKVNATGVEKVTMAHIHGAKSGQNGDPIAMLQIEKSGPNLAQGNISASDLMGSLAGKSISDLVDKMKSGETYVNVHTEANPNGEIRGQIEMSNATMTSK